MSWRNTFSSANPTRHGELMDRNKVSLTSCTSCSAGSSLTEFSERGEQPPAPDRLCSAHRMASPRLHQQHVSTSVRSLAQVIENKTETPPRLFISSLLCSFLHSLRSQFWETPCCWSRGAAEPWRPPPSTSSPPSCPPWTASPGPARCNRAGALRGPGGPLCEQAARRTRLWRVLIHWPRCRCLTFIQIILLHNTRLSLMRLIFSTCSGHVCRSGLIVLTSAWFLLSITTRNQWGNCLASTLNRPQWLTMHGKCFIILLFTHDYNRHC